MGVYCSLCENCGSNTKGNFICKIDGEVLQIDYIFSCDNYTEWKESKE